MVFLKSVEIGLDFCPFAMGLVLKASKTHNLLRGFVILFFIFKSRLSPVPIGAGCCCAVCLFMVCVVMTVKIPGPIIPGTWTPWHFNI